MDHSIIQTQTSHPVVDRDATLVRKNLYQPIPRALLMSARCPTCATSRSHGKAVQYDLTTLGVHVSQSEKQTTPDT